MLIRSQVHEEEDVLGMWGPDVFSISGGTAVISVSLRVATVTITVTTTNPFGSCSFYGFVLKTDSYLSEERHMSRRTQSQLQSRIS